MPKQRNVNVMYKDLFFDSYIQVMKITKQKKRYVDLDISQEMRDKVLDIKKTMSDD
jgi:hypothetical protein